MNKSIPSATQHLKQKQPAFKESGFSAVVIASLSLLLYDHDTFSAAVLAKSNLAVGEEKIREGVDAVGNIHDVIHEAIVYYSVNAV